MASKLKDKNKEPSSVKRYATLLYIQGTMDRTSRTLNKANSNTYFPYFLF